MLSDPFKGIWWPPTRKWKGHGLNHLVIFYGLDVFLFDFWRIVPWCSMEIITIKAPPFWRICSRNFFQASNKQIKGIRKKTGRWIGRKITHTHTPVQTDANGILFRWSFPEWPAKKNPKAPWSSLKAILLRCVVSLCDGRWFGWISESPWPFTEKKHDLGCL